MIMEPFEVYRYYLALRLHFTTDQYDVIASQGRVRASRQAFNKRKDLLSIKRIADLYSDKEIVDFLVANFVTGDRWGGIFDIEAKDRYIDWKKRIESLSYIFDKELLKLVEICDRDNKPYTSIFKGTEDVHPLIVKSYLRNDVSIETLVILDKINNYTDELDVVYKDDLIWPDMSRVIKKYKPFLTVKLEKYNDIFRRRFGSSTS